MSSFGRIPLSSFALCRASTGSRSPPPRLCLAPSPPAMRTRAIAQLGLRRVSPHLAEHRPDLAPARRTGFVGTASDRSGLRRKPATRPRLVCRCAQGVLGAHLGHVRSSPLFSEAGRLQFEGHRARYGNKIAKKLPYFTVTYKLRASFRPNGKKSGSLRYIVPKSPALARRYRLFEQSQARLRSFRYYMAIFS